MKEFVAFRALVALLEETGQSHMLESTYLRCKEQQHKPKEEIKNELIALYDMFSYEQVSKKIAQLLTPPGLEAEVQIIYQTIEGLHDACPDHRGDWYFSGKYPTPGGNRVVNTAFINFIENKDVRAYV
jgi:amidophosphoribosyltransferase